MKLYDVPRNTKVRVTSPVQLPPAHVGVDEQEIITFHHIDGMYSYCTNEQGEIVHPAAWTEVEIIEEK